MDSHGPRGPGFPLRQPYHPSNQFGCEAFAMVTWSKPTRLPLLALSFVVLRGSFLTAQWDVSIHIESSPESRGGRIQVVHGRGKLRFFSPVLKVTGDTVFAVSPVDLVADLTQDSIEITSVDDTNRVSVSAKMSGGSQLRALARRVGVRRDRSRVEVVGIPERAQSPI
jgi:hypothetical protein